MTNRGDQGSRLSKKLLQIYHDTGIFEHLDQDERAGLELGRKELEALAAVALGAQYDRSKLEAVIKLQQILQVEQGKLSRELSSGKISRPEYLRAFNNLALQIFAECDRILGSGDFEKLFGCRAKDAGNMIDPELFLGAAPTES